METFTAVREILSSMFLKCSKGLGQLEAYTDVPEGVALQMDNGLFWDSLGSYCCHLTIAGIPEKSMSCKFFVISLPSGKVLLKNWLGMCLAPITVGIDPETYPIRPVEFSMDVSLMFSVFHHENQVAFQAYNHRFLARVHRDGFHLLEAAKFFIDSSCYFRPQIGDLHPPTFDILRVIPREVWQVKYLLCPVDWINFINWGDKPIRHTLNMIWKDTFTDRIFWNRTWGLGLHSVSPTFTVGNAKLTVKYSEENQHALSVKRDIYEIVSHTLMVPPRTRVIACLFAYQAHHASLPFTAIIRKVSCYGKEVILQENGAWMGFIYRDLWVHCSLKKLDTPCPDILSYVNWGFVKKNYIHDHELPSPEKK